MTCPTRFRPRHVPEISGFRYSYPLTPGQKKFMGEYLIEELKGSPGYRSSITFNPNASLHYSGENPNARESALEGQWIIIYPYGNMKALNDDEMKEKFEMC
jgi:hypothetical protein